MSRCRHCGSDDTADDPMGALWCQRCDRVTFPAMDGGDAGAPSAFQRDHERDMADPEYAAAFKAARDELTIGHAGAHDATTEGSGK